MSLEMPPSTLPVPLKDACTLSVECWRLARLAASLKDASVATGLRLAARRIAQALQEMEMEVIDYAGRPYDPGMVPEVVEVREDHTLPQDSALVDETVAPTVTWRGTVVSSGMIVVRRPPGGQMSESGVPG